MLFASRGVFLLLHLEEFYDTDWYNTLSEVLEVLKRAQKRILELRMQRKKDSDMKQANNNQNVVPSSWAQWTSRDQLQNFLQKLQQFITLPILMQDIDS